MNLYYLLALIQSQMFKIEYILMKLETLPTIPVSINMIKNSVQSKNPYKLELQTRIWCFKFVLKFINKPKTGEDVPGLEVVEVFLL